jgi:hypothetical protein
MSMLNLYINRAGRGLTTARKMKLERAKQELRKLYGRKPSRTTRSRARARARRPR